MQSYCRRTEVTSKTKDCKKVYMLRFERDALVSGSASKRNWTVTMSFCLLFYVFFSPISYIFLSLIYLLFLILCCIIDLWWPLKPYQGWTWIISCWKFYRGNYNYIFKGLDLISHNSFMEMFEQVDIFEPKMSSIDIRRLQCKLKDIYFPYIQVCWLIHNARI